MLYYLCLTTSVVLSNNVNYSFAEKLMINAFYEQYFFFSLLWSFFLNYFYTGRVQVLVAFHAFTLRASFGSTVGIPNLRVSPWKDSASVPWGNWKPWVGSKSIWSVHQRERTSLPFHSFVYLQVPLPLPCILFLLSTYLPSFDVFSFFLFFLKMLYVDKIHISYNSSICCI